MRVILYFYLKGDPMRKFLLIGAFLVGLSIPCYAQFIGIRIGIPMVQFNGGGGSPPVVNNVTYLTVPVTYLGQTVTYLGK